MIRWSGDARGWKMGLVDELGLDTPRYFMAGLRTSSDMSRQIFVTARAVARLRKLLGWTMPLLSSGGSLLALKGVSVDEEIDEAIPELRRYKAAFADVHAVTPFGSHGGDPKWPRFGEGMILA